MNGITRGITEVDPEIHVVVGNYRSHVDEGESGVHVIEMDNTRASHFEDRILVFGRFITKEELERREAAFQANPEVYAEDHIKSLAK